MGGETERHGKPQRPAVVIPKGSDASNRGTCRKTVHETRPQEAVNELSKGSRGVVV